MVRRSLPETGKLKVLDEGLRGLFRSLEQRALPDRLLVVVDQLDQIDAPARRRA
jgi:hypothetical protein